MLLAGFKLQVFQHQTKPRLRCGSMVQQSSCGIEQHKQKKQQRRYTWWNVWKERNRRIFQGLAKEDIHVAMLTKEDIEGYSPAKFLNRNDL